MYFSTEGGEMLSENEKKKTDEVFCGESEVCSGVNLGTTSSLVSNALFSFSSTAGWVFNPPTMVFVWQTVLGWVYDNDCSGNLCPQAM